ncbi:MAG: DUF4465 domain-containing protein [Alistipes sp.]|nr:DUF4465 domain-containing protein [Alistipes sp.]
MKKIFLTLAVALAGAVMVGCSENPGGYEDPENPGNGDSTETPGYELRILTFEDKDYKGSATNGATYWSDLIPDSQYGEGNGHHSWYDEGNTFLAFIPSPTALYPGYGGHAVSNYVGSELSQGDYTHDLQAYKVEGGANGSENFCVHFGYLDDSGMGMQNELVYFEFGDETARVIDHMFVTNTTYVYNTLFSGDANFGGSYMLSDVTTFKIVAYGYESLDDEEPTTSECYLLSAGRNFVETWTKWDLSALGSVVKVEFNLVGSEDTYGAYGLVVPGYFAYDDVAVRF